MKRKKNVYRIIKERNRVYNKQERERLSEINDFHKDEIVTLIQYNRPFKGIVKRINAKTYTIMTEHDEILICKEKLSGYFKSLIADVSGDGRRYIKEEVKLIMEKENNEN